MLLNVIFANFLGVGKASQISKMLSNLNAFCVKHLNIFSAYLLEKHMQPIQGK